MPRTHTISQTWQSGSNSEASSFTKTAESETILERDGTDTLLSTTTPYVMVLNLTPSVLTSVFMVATRQVQVRTRSTGTPGNTLTLPASVPLIWTSDMTFFANPFTTESNGLIHVYNTSGTSADFLACVLQDASA